MKQYIGTLRKELSKSNLGTTEISEIIFDYKEMISSALEEGISEEEIVEKFGDPRKIASELEKDDDNKTTEQKDINGFQLWKEFDVFDNSISLDINLVNENTYYQISNYDKISVYYNGNVNIEKYELSFTNSELKLKSLKRLLVFAITQKNKEFIVELPKAIFIDKFEQKTVNGEKRIINLEIEKAKISTVNGDLIIESTSIGEGKINSVNGDLRLNNVKGESLTISQISGDTKVKKTKIRGAIKTSSVSGDIELKDVTCSEFKLSTVSGDLLGEEFYPQELAFSSVSGDIEIENQEKNTIKHKKIKTMSRDSKIN